MNEKLMHWFKHPHHQMAVIHLTLVFLAAIAIGHFGHWSLWLIAALALGLSAVSMLQRWIEDEELEEKALLILHGVISALWGLAFFTVFSGQWPLLLFVAATLIVGYLLIFAGTPPLVAAGTVPLALALAVNLLQHGYYLSAVGLAMLLGLALWQRFYQASDAWGDEAAEPLSAAMPLPVVSPPAGPDPEQAAKIAELKNRIRQLETDLSSAEMTKMEFLATMSHEIRTPLNGIIPLLDILLDSELSDFQKDYLQTAYVSAKQMQKLIDDLLDYSKVEAGKLTIENVGLKLPRVLESVVKALEPSARKKNLHIELQVSPYVSPLLRGDPLRVRQVVTNLLSNAIKFSDRGSIILRLDRVKDLGDRERVRIEVQDQGIGIDDEQQAVLFQPFTQADGSSTRKFGGTGIGLAISKKIVDLMGGEIGVESKKGAGSTFWVELPLLKPAHQTPRHEDQGASSEPAQPHLQAIILNTSFSATQTWQQQLKKHGIHSKPVSNLHQIQESLKASRQLNNNRNHFLVFVDFDTAPKQARSLIAQLMDDQSPGDFTLCIITSQQRIAGVPNHPRIHLLGPQHSLAEVLAHLDENPSATEKTTDTPSLVSAHSDEPTFGGLSLEGDDEDSDEDGDQYPDTTPLPEAASETATGPGISVAAETTSGQQIESSTTDNGQQAVTPETDLDERVLLVEDNDVNLKVAQKLIQYIGYTFDVAKNGLEALEKVKKTRYRMVLMDCQMPVMDGYLCTQRIREYEKAEGLNSTPIVAMTANAMMGDREKCLNAGMDDYMSKPLNRYVLEKTLKKWDPMQNRPASASGPATPSRPAAQSGINDKWLNTKTLGEIREFMGDDVDRLLSLFKQDAPGTLRHMRQALQTKNLAELRTLAHSLKSSSANIGARGLSYFCKRMEAEALSGDMQRLNALMENIKKSYLLTVREIDKYGKK